MMSSTYYALKLYGLPTRDLQRSAKRNFKGGSGRALDMPDEHSWRFWNAMIESRRRFRMMAGFDIESILRG